MKVIYVVLVCLLTFTSCAETEYAENGVDKKNITDRKSTRLNSSHQPQPRMPSSA